MTVKMPFLLKCFRSFSVMPDRRRRTAGQQRGDFPGQLPHLVRQSGGLHSQRSLAISVDELATARLITKHFSQ